MYCIATSAGASAAGADAPQAAMDRAIARTSSREISFFIVFPPNWFYKYI
jgi:hypothetical protein